MVRKPAKKVVAKALFQENNTSDEDMSEDGTSESEDENDESNSDVR